jgi:U6 snRNA-associated Sm-like protein LSm7
MSDRGSFRAGRGGGRGGSGAESGHRGGRGGARGGQGGHQSGERPKKENILDLTKYMDKEINVKFNGGREGEPCPSPITSTRFANAITSQVVGTLKGYDQLMNLVLDDVREFTRG